MLWEYGGMVLPRFWVICFTGFQLYVLTGYPLISSRLRRIGEDDNSC